MTKIWPISVMIAMACLSACGKDDLLNPACDEPQRYKSVVAGKRVEAPEGLDPLNEYAEMPVPKADDLPPRPPGSRCIEMPPNVGTDK